MKTNKNILNFLVFSLIGAVLAIGLYLFITDKNEKLLKQSSNESEKSEKMPWELISLLAAAPITLYMWYWTNENSRRTIDDQRVQSAIHNLESKELNIRLAGIYTLENVAFEHKSRVPNIVEILNCHVRAKANKKKRTEKVKMEIKICLDIISRIWQNYNSNWSFNERLQPDLRKVKLNELEMWKIFLSDFFLEEADFTDSYLERANFKNANLNHAQFKNANLKNANLQNAVVYGTDFSEVDLKEGNWIPDKMLASMKGCPSTQLPVGKKRPESWKRTTKCEHYIRCKKRACECNNSSQMHQ